MFNVNQYILENRQPGGFVSIKLCKDGFSISIQASKYHRSSKSGENRDLYDTVECRFPTEIPDNIMEYCEDPDEPLDTVYNYVPVKLVEELIDYHNYYHNNRV